ncbi:MAG TPA: hypothetical protein VFY23_06805 [Candidatus Limnocylindrales bacterium]|nr:hypothetical protein [Candidatus Limnocylindrales bacterium]
MTLTPDAGPPGTLIRATAGVRCADDEVILRLFLYEAEGPLAPPPDGAATTEVRATGEALGMVLVFRVPRLAPGSYQLAVDCPAYQGAEGDLPAGVYPLSPDRLEVTGPPDTATDPASVVPNDTARPIAAVLTGLAAAAVILASIPRRRRARGSRRPGGRAAMGP